jgi:flagellar basal body-associated protein FliL
MKFLEKIENLINAFLIKLGELFLGLFGKITPTALKAIWLRIETQSSWVKAQIKDSPTLLKNLAITAVPRIKAAAQALDIKTKLTNTYQTALSKYHLQTEAQTGRFKRILLTPFFLMSEWLRGLTLTQSIVLVSSTAASFVAAVAIMYSGERMIGQGTEKDRAPASVVVEYERPDYYKKQNRQLTFTNVRLPVYIPEVNELKSVDIDFSLTLSNRESRTALGKKEFELRDHLILEVEPVIAAFPLEEEGKTVIKEKILMEINQFMVNHQLEGSVEEVEITYILAN